MQLDLFSTIEQEVAKSNAEVFDKKHKTFVSDSDKLYSTITEVALIFDVKPSLLRFWEKEFSQIKLRKNGKGDRLYTKEDIELIGTIYYLTKVRRFTLEGTREYLAAKRKTSTTTERSLVEQLNEMKKFLLELKKSLA